MGVGFDVVILGSQRVERRYQRIIDRARNPNPAFALIRQDFRRVMVKQFDSQGRYLLGQGWTPLAEVTMQDKAAIGADPRILHRTRAMRKAFTTGQGARVNMGGETLEISVKQKYAYVHQLGSRKTPKRQIVKLGRREARRWSRTMMRYYVHGELMMQSY